MLSEAAARSDALADLLGAGDVRLISDSNDDVVLVRTHRNTVTRYEAGTLPVVPPGMG